MATTIAKVYILIITHVWYTLQKTRFFKRIRPMKNLLQFIYLYIHISFLGTHYYLIIHPKSIIIAWHGFGISRDDSLTKVNLYLSGKRKILTKKKQVHWQLWMIKILITINLTNICFKNIHDFMIDILIQYMWISF